MEFSHQRWRTRLVVARLLFEHVLYVFIEVLQNLQGLIVRWLWAFLSERELLLLVVVTDNFILFGFTTYSNWHCLLYFVSFKLSFNFICRIDFRWILHSNAYLLQVFPLIFNTLVLRVRLKLNCLIVDIRFIF